MKSLLAILGLCLLPLAAQAQIDVGVGTSFSAFLDENGTLDNLEAFAGTASFELSLNDSGDDYLGVGLPIAADQDELIWSFFADYRRRIAKSDGFVNAGFQMTFVPKDVLDGYFDENRVAEEDRGTVIFAGPKLSLWFAVPMGSSGEEERYLPVEVSGFMGWEFAGIPDDVESKPKILGFSATFPNDILE